MKRYTLLGLLAFVPGFFAVQAAPEPHLLTPVPIQQVEITDDFWGPKRKIWRDVTIADCFNKFEKDGAIRNFELIRDGKKGDHGGPQWYDGLMYEMIRGCADFLASQRDAELEKRLDGYIDVIAAAAARDPDGYINTWTQLKQPTQRFGMNGGDDNSQHDVYNAGALVEAAEHYYRATGKTKLLQVAVRMANYMCATMGPPPKANVVPGHSVAEESFVKFYRLFQEQPGLKAQLRLPVNETNFLKLAEFWIENRGNHAGRKSFGTYGQDHTNFTAMDTIEGHAVRATLFCTGIAAAGYVNGREEFSACASRLWENMVNRRMHITGSVGAFADGERFGPDYQLPNNAYLETCAAIGAAFFHHRMNLLFAESRYVDELERALYNGVLSGVSLKGDSYFYTNPLEAQRDRKRWAWHGCPCCPPMFMKVVGALPGYLYAQDQDGIYVNLFVGNRAKIQVGDTALTVKQTTSYPWEGKVQLRIEKLEQARGAKNGRPEFSLNFRIPAWSQGATLKVNRKQVTPELARGYARVKRQWKAGDEVEFSVPLPVRRLYSHPKVEANVGRVALMRGPLVYCVEGCDHTAPLRSLVLPNTSTLRAERARGLLGGVWVIKGAARALQPVEWPDTLYLTPGQIPADKTVELTAIPYYANANRTPSELLVWLADSLLKAVPTGKAAEATPSASHCNPSDGLFGLNDGIEPKNSADESIPRFTWWDHRGTAEWVQYDFPQKTKVSGVEIYWWDERAIQRHCRVPKTWRVLYRQGSNWQPVSGISTYGTNINQFNRVAFAPVQTTALRVEVQLQPEWSGGILEWKVLTR